MVLSFLFAAAAGILIAKIFKDKLLGVIGLAVAFSLIEAFFEPTLALTSIAIAVLAFFAYVILKTDMVALTPTSREERRERRSRAAAGVE